MIQENVLKSKIVGNHLQNVLQTKPSTFRIFGKLRIKTVNLLYFLWAKCVSATFAVFLQENVQIASRKWANPRFRIAAIYPSVNLQPFIKIPKDTQHYVLTVALRYLLKKGVMHTTFIFFKYWPCYIVLSVISRRKDMGTTPWPCPQNHMTALQCPYS